MSELDTLPDGEILGWWGGADDVGRPLPMPEVGDARHVLKMFAPARAVRNRSALVIQDDGSLAVAVRFGGTGWQTVWLVDRTGDEPELTSAPAWANQPGPYLPEDALAEVRRILEQRS